MLRIRNMSGRGANRSEGLIYSDQTTISLFPADSARKKVTIQARRLQLRYSFSMALQQHVGLGPAISKELERSLGAGGRK
jgi:hypothetical protein